LVDVEAEAFAGVGGREEAGLLAGTDAGTRLVSFLGMKAKEDMDRCQDAVDRVNALIQIGANGLAYLVPPIRK